MFLRASRASVAVWNSIATICLTIPFSLMILASEIPLTSDKRRTVAWATWEASRKCEGASDGGTKSDSERIQIKVRCEELEVEAIYAVSGVNLTTGTETQHRYPTTPRAERTDSIV